MDIAFLIAGLLGGLALFIFGMDLMTVGLHKSTGASLRHLLGKTARHPSAGLAMGTTLGLLVQSSAATVMLVGFVNAGLLSLAGSVPAMLGANVGTTLSMQAVSLRLGDYAFFAIAIGFIISAMGRSDRTKHIGRALLGFGLLFLGMTVMSDAIRPHRAALQPFLSAVDGNTLPGALLGIAVAAGLTAIWQSSGATIGMCFALVDAGVFTGIEQVFPIILGAHIGTCATALLSSMGSNIEARRTAVSHLLFNVLNTGLALATKPLLFIVVAWISDDLTRQTANINTLFKLVGALVFLPFWKLHARLVTLLVRSKEPPPVPSFLASHLVRTPENAVQAAIRELRRATGICTQSYALLAPLMLLRVDRASIRRLKSNEDVLNRIKQHMKDYLLQVARRKLSRRQIIVMEDIDRCMSSLERIGDHIDRIGDISLRHVRVPASLVSEAQVEALFGLYQQVGRILSDVEASLDIEASDAKSVVDRLLKERQHYAEQRGSAQDAHAEEVSGHAVTPQAALFYREYLSNLDRIVRHAESIALRERNPDFRIKRKKLDRHVEKGQRAPAHDVVAPEAFLRRLDPDQ